MKHARSPRSNREFDANVEDAVTQAAALWRSAGTGYVPDAVLEVIGATVEAMDGQVDRDDLIHRARLRKYEGEGGITASERAALVRYSSRAVNDASAKALPPPSARRRTRPSTASPSAITTTPGDVHDGAASERANYATASDEAARRGTDQPELERVGWGRRLIASLGVAFATGVLMASVGTVVALLTDDIEDARVRTLIMNGALTVLALTFVTVLLLAVRAARRAPLPTSTGGLRKDIYASFYYGWPGLLVTVALTMLVGWTSFAVDEAQRVASATHTITLAGQTAGDDWELDASAVVKTSAKHDTTALQVVVFSNGTSNRTPHIRVTFGSYACETPRPYLWSDSTYMTLELPCVREVPSILYPGQLDGRNEAIRSEVLERFTTGTVTLK